MQLEQRPRQELLEATNQTSNPMGAWGVYGGQVGSEGKGAVAGYLARKYRWGAAACTFMTNAGHTFIGDDDEKVVVQQLPLGLVSDSVGLLVIGPGSAITPAQLEKELNSYDHIYGVERRLRIDPRAVIIEDHHVTTEQETIQYLASTMKGCGAALADKALRHPRVKLARDIAWLRPYLNDTADTLNDLINTGHGVLVEGSQGFDLDINHGIEYPYCTSRGTTITQVMADLGLDGKLLTRSIAVIRSFPIRVGNIEKDGARVGYSGSFGGDELSWDQVTALSGSETPLEERTTVTQRVRRVFNIDYDRLKRMSMITRPTDIALTFVDYIDNGMKGKTTQDVAGAGRLLTRKVMEMVYQIEKAVNRRTAAPKVNLFKTGPRNREVIDWLGRSWGTNF